MFIYMTKRYKKDARWTFNICISIYNYIYIYMPERMPNRMSEVYMSGRIPDIMSEYIMSEYVSDRISVGEDHSTKELV